MTPHLDLGVRAFLDRLALLDTKPLGDLAPAEAREQHLKLVQFGQGTFPDHEVFQVEDTTYSRVPVRTYRMSDDAPRTVVVYLHGGGWVLGSLDTADPCARAIAASLDCTVISVDYRLAPEHPFPAAVDDCRAVLEYVTALYPASRIAVAGDSAGGNLALAITSASLTSDDLRVDAQLLLYPALDPGQSAASHNSFSDGYVLTKDDMRWFWDTYLGDVPAVDYGPRVEASHLTGMPPTVVTTAGFDPLQDEGRALAGSLIAANVPTTYIPHTNLVHGWMDFAGTVPAAAEARSAALGALAQALESVPVPAAKSATGRRLR